MADTCIWTGASGKKYEYKIFSLDGNWNDVPGNYISSSDASPIRRATHPYTSYGDEHITLASWSGTHQPSRILTSVSQVPLVRLVVYGKTRARWTRKTTTLRNSLSHRAMPVISAATRLPNLNPACFHLTTRLAHAHPAMAWAWNSFSIHIKLSRIRT